MKWPRFIVTFLILISLAGLLRSSLKASPQAPPPALAPLYSPGPVTDYQAALPNQSEVLRFRRGERYNIDDSTLPELGEDSKVAVWELPPSHFKKNPMPFNTSDAVVVGTVTAGKSYISNDKRNIYSEFKVTIQDTLKGSVAPYPRVGDSIDIQRPGGAIRLPSGKVLTRAPLADSMPEVGRRYLFFLKYDPSTEDYVVLMGYQLAGNEVYRLDELNPQDANYDHVLHLLRREGVSENQFLANAKAAFLAQRKGGS